MKNSRNEFYWTDITVFLGKKNVGHKCHFSEPHVPYVNSGSFLMKENRFFSNKPVCSWLFYYHLNNNNLLMDNKLNVFDYTY